MDEQIEAGQVEAVARAIKELAREKGRKWVGDEAIEAMMDEVHWQACLETATVAIKASGAEHIAGLVSAAEKVIKRWESPEWTWDIHTGVYIHELRGAIESLPPELRGK